VVDVLGKLFGVTSLVWISTALILIGHGAIGGVGWNEILSTAASCVLWQVASFWASLLLLRLGGQRMRGHTTVAQLLGLAVIGMSSIWSWPRACTAWSSTIICSAPACRSS